MKKLVTHSGPFHTDEIFAIAIIQLLLEQNNESYELIRTRDNSIIETGDYVFDVGKIYAPEKNRFDHHQTEGAGKRENGIPYASIGLAWKHFGMQLCGNNETVWKRIDEKMIAPIDADDNGIDTYTLDPIYNTEPYFFKSAVKSFYPPWNKEKNFDEQFEKVLGFAKQVMQNQINLGIARFDATALVEKDYESSQDKQIIVLEGAYPWKEILSKKPEVIFVIYKNTDGKWSVQGVPRDEKDEFTIAKQLPESWAGLDDSDLAKASGVPDAYFCHRGRWLCGAKSFEGAMELAKKALLM